MNILNFVFLLVGLPQILAVCFPNTVCEKQRDTIIQLDSSVLATEKLYSRGRAWYIQPSNESFNAILAFKNFSSTPHASVIVIAYTSPTDRRAHYLYGDLGNFEVIIRDSIGIIIYVPISSRKTADFVLNYYTGCQILTSAQDQISYPQPLQSPLQNQIKCWFIQPTNLEDRKRIYFSIRDVALNSGQMIAIWDVHTSDIITTATDGEEYKLVAAEAEDYQSVMIDLICTNEVCRSKLNSFFISYYGLTQVDITCIEMQKLCSEKDEISSENCTFTCPAFDSMLLEEYSLEINTIMTRSGEVRESEQEEEEEEEEEENRPRERCPPRFPRRFCNCPRNVNRRRFCSPNVRCLAQGQCTFACILHKMATCLKIKLLKSLKLF